jgi:DNA-binding response OmpR family regulator
MLKKKYKKYKMYRNFCVNLEIFKIMNSEPSIKNIPVIALFPFATKWTRKRFLELGLADCIAKPFVMHDFIRTVNKHLYGGTSAE